MRACAVLLIDTLCCWALDRRESHQAQLDALAHVRAFLAMYHCDLLYLSYVRASLAMHHCGLLSLSHVRASLAMYTHSALLCIIVTCSPIYMGELLSPSLE